MKGASVVPWPDDEISRNAAVQAWDMACRQSAKAWTESGVQRLVRREIVDRAMVTLEQGDAASIAQLVVEMTGNAAMVAAAGGTAELMARSGRGIQAHQVQVIAASVLEAIVLPLLPTRPHGVTLDLWALNEACRHWIATGTFPEGVCDPGPAGQWLLQDLHKITALMAGDATPADAAAIRLGALCIAAPALEGLRQVMSRATAAGGQRGPQPDHEVEEAMREDCHA